MANVKGYYLRGAIRCPFLLLIIYQWLGQSAASPGHGSIMRPRDLLALAT